MGLNNYNSSGDNEGLKTRGLLISPGTSYIHLPDSWLAHEKEVSPSNDSFHVLLVAGPSLVAQGLKKKKQKKNLPAMQEMWIQSLGWEDLEKEMATHSSILSWEIPWAEEPGGLQSSGLESIGLYTKATEH